MKRKYYIFFLAILGHVAVVARDYNIIDYGAKNDTTVLSTKFVQQAIDDCSRAGGGRVFVPTGSYKIGSIELRSNVHLHLERGATLYGSTRLEDYRPMKSDYVYHRRTGPCLQETVVERRRHHAATSVAYYKR